MTGPSCKLSQPINFELKVCRMAFELTGTLMSLSNKYQNSQSHFSTKLQFVISNDNYSFIVCGHIMAVTV